MRRTKPATGGGKPEVGLPEKDFSEWIEALWARDIPDLFSIGKRYFFVRFLELLRAQSGGMCELTKFTSACEASRQTVANDPHVFAATGVVHVLRPSATNPIREIVAMPQVHAFATGFVCKARSIDSLRARPDRDARSGDGEPRPQRHDHPARVAA